MFEQVYYIPSRVESLIVIENSYCAFFLSYEGQLKCHREGDGVKRVGLICCKRGLGGGGEMHSLLA